MIIVTLSFSAQFEIEKELKRNLENQKKWVGVASHELKTPINGILGLSRILAEKRLDQESKQYVHLINETAEHANKLVSELLMSSIETQAHFKAAEKTHFNLIETAVQAAHLFEPRARAKGIYFEIQKPRVDATVLGQAHLLSRIIFKLVENALKYTDSGHIKVEFQLKLEAKQASLKILVNDTGRGISPSDLPRIFDPFYRGPKSKHGVEGSGLGLAICREIVESLEGQISVKSEPGIGSLFSVQLHFPLITDLNSELFEGAKILIADDNFINREILKFDLLKLGLKADLASDGEEALKLIQQNKYEFIFLDCHMPHKNGFECAKEAKEYLKQIGNKKDFKIVGFTADHTHECRQRALLSGMDDVLNKPYDQVTLENLTKDLRPDSWWGGGERAQNLREFTERVFDEELPEIINSINQLLQRGDFEALKDKIHYFKSSCMAIDHSSGIESCQKIEASCQQPLRIPEIEAEVSKLTQLFISK